MAMNKPVVFLIILGLFFSCSGNKHSEASIWQVESSTMKGSILIQGAIIEFTPDSIRVQIGGKADSYPMIMNSKRLLIIDGETKWLFQIESSSAQELRLTELYNNPPGIVQLKRRQ